MKPQSSSSSRGGRAPIASSHWGSGEAPAGHVHRQVGGYLLTRAQANPGNVRHAVVSGRPGDQPRDSSASPDLQMRGRGHRRDGCLHHASQAGDALERAVLLAGRAPDLLGGIKDRVEANGSRSGQSLLRLGQLGVQETAMAGQEEVRKPELVDPFTLQAAPDLLSPAGGASASRSRTVTWWPCPHSKSPAPRPTTPAPTITILAMATRPSPLATRKAYARPRFPPRREPLKRLAMSADLLNQQAARGTSGRTGPPAGLVPYRVAERASQPSSTPRMFPPDARPRPSADPAEAPVGGYARPPSGSAATSSDQSPKPLDVIDWVWAARGGGLDGRHRQCPLAGTDVSAYQQCADVASRRLFLRGE